jgi:ABC-type uncharacterized transport system permease subunit
VSEPAGHEVPGRGVPGRGVPGWVAILRGLGPRQITLRVGAPIIALVIALIITMIVLRMAGVDPFNAIISMIDYGTTSSSVVEILNRATGYYLSAVAVAIGFRMALFNIGVDGQYRMAAMLAAFLGGAVALPAPLGQIMVIVAAMLIGGAWAAIAGLLKVTRGVSEVISTIMLNAIATGLIAYLLNPARLAEVRPGSNNVATTPIPKSGQVPGFDLPGGKVFGLIVLAAAVGIAMQVVINRTRFGYDLRISGLSPTAARASGVNSRRMVVTTMALSGAVAGLVGMPELLGASYQYSLNFPAGLGFTGIAIALLGRNNPFGIGLAALLFSFLDQSSDVLQLNDVPKEIVLVMQGTVVLTVVIVYELVRRFEIRLQQRAVAAELAAGHVIANEEPAGGSRA